MAPTRQGSPLGTEPVPATHRVVSKKQTPSGCPHSNRVGRSRNGKGGCLQGRRGPPRQRGHVVGGRKGGQGREACTPAPQRTRQDTGGASQTDRLAVETDRFARARPASSCRGGATGQRGRGGAEAAVSGPVDASRGGVCVGTAQVLESSRLQAPLGAQTAPLAGDNSSTLYAKRFRHRLQVTDNNYIYV